MHRVESEYFTATYGRDWHPETEPEWAGKSALFRRPGSDIEVRVVGWLRRSPVKDPMAEAVKLMAREPAFKMAGLQVPSESAVVCSGAPVTVEFFGHSVPLMDVSASGSSRVLMLVGQAEGALVVVAARQPAPSTGDCSVLGEAIAQLAAGIEPSLRQLTPPPGQTISPLNGRP